MAKALLLKAVLFPENYWCLKQINSAPLSVFPHDEGAENRKGEDVGVRCF